MDPDEIINSNSNVRESSTNNEQRERSTIQKTISLSRKRRGTHSNGDGSNSSTKQTFTTAINQILNRRSSISSQRPKDLLAEINTNRSETINSTQIASPSSPTAVNAPFKQPQNQLSQNQPSHSTQPIQRLLRKKSLRSINGQYSPVSPSQSSPLSPTVEENLSDSLSDIDSNNNLNYKRTHHGTNSSSANSSASSISSPRKQFLFEISSREQKLLMSSQTSQTKDDRMEKLLKKAKIFLDAKQRPKARIVSLWSFTGMFIF